MSKQLLILKHLFNKSDQALPRIQACRNRVSLFSQRELAVILKCISTELQQVIKLAKVDMVLSASILLKAIVSLKKGKEVIQLDRLLNFSRIHSLLSQLQFRFLTVFDQIHRLLAIKNKARGMEISKI